MGGGVSGCSLSPIKGKWQNVKATRDFKIIIRRDEGHGAGPGQSGTGQAVSVSVLAAKLTKDVGSNVTEAGHKFGSQAHTHTRIHKLAKSKANCGSLSASRVIFLLSRSLSLSLALSPASLIYWPTFCGMY